VFKYNTEGGVPYIQMAGPRVECTDYEYCVNAWNSVSSSMGNARFNGEDEENDRRLRAAELIKETCPGEPY
jgi:hypothetical protein